MSTCKPRDAAVMSMLHQACLVADATVSDITFPVVFASLLMPLISIIQVGARWGGFRVAQRTGDARIRPEGRAPASPWCVTLQSDADKKNYSREFSNN